MPSDRDFNFSIFGGFFDASSEKSCTEGRRTAKLRRSGENIIVRAFD